MGAIQLADLTVLADDDLYSLFAIADQVNDKPLATACDQEITRRAGQHSPTVTHEVPAGLAKWLPRAFWHQKPEGEGRG